MGGWGLSWPGQTTGGVLRDGESAQEGGNLRCTIQGGGRTESSGESGGRR